MKNKFNTEICDNNMSFQECELAILRQAVDEVDKLASSKIAQNEDIKKMINIVEEFLQKKKSICYGGTAINNILPKQAQFYNRDLEIPDYDFYSTTPVEDAKELADIYHENGFLEIEAKAGVHHGTYKVFVNFIPIADITYLHPILFKSISKEAISVAGILYAPPNFLRMNMFIELSRPSGDVSRWEKILKRLTLLNKHHPMKIKDCSKIDFQRKMESYTDYSQNLYLVLREIFVNQDVVFLGGYATRMYGKYSGDVNSIVKKVPDFDVISEDPERTAMIIIERLRSMGFKKATIVKHEAIGEVIPAAVEVRIAGKETLAFIYHPIACHSYNEVKINDLSIKVATIDTMLNFYLAFYYSNKPYHVSSRLLCMANFLFQVENRNRLEQKGPLKRFSIDCYGTQPTMESIRSEKIEKFKELKEKRGTKEYDEWFLKYGYSSGELIGETQKEKKNKSIKKNKNKKKNKTMKSGLLKEFGSLFN